MWTNFDFRPTSHIGLLQAASLHRLLHILAKENVLKLDENRDAPNELGGFEVLDVPAFQR
jgi:hypothetical protein